MTLIRTSDPQSLEILPIKIFVPLSAGNSWDCFARQAPRLVTVRRRFPRGRPDSDWATGHEET
ncbi:hypothetical protein ACWCO0_29045 [Streptomyces tubercidicus]